MSYICVNLIRKMFVLAAFHTRFSKCLINPITIEEGAPPPMFFFLNFKTVYNRTLKLLNFIEFIVNRLS